jgi:hypothetical protein
MSLGVFPHNRLRNRMVFERGKFGRLNKLTLLLVILKIQHTSKVNISDNTLK